MRFKIDRLAAVHCRVGESPVWDGEGNRLFWCDIPNARIYAYESEGGGLSHLTLPEPVASFGLAAPGMLVVALLSGVYLFDIATQHLTFLVDPEPEQAGNRPRNRLNDGKVGPDGAFWVGSMHPDTSSGALYRVTADGRCERKVEGLRTSNGLAFSPDGKILFHSDSRACWIDSHALDPSNGTLGERVRVATPGEADGRPDGGAFDMEGHYWSAGVSAGCLNRYAIDGTLVERIPVPVKAPTMPCFGGPDMKTLFFTSIRRPDDATDECGNVFMMKVDVAGVPVGRFGDTAGSRQSEPAPMSDSGAASAGSILSASN